MIALVVARELLREALARKWILGLLALVTVVLSLAAAALRLEVVDGALAASRLFGSDLETDIVAADVALRPVFKVTAFIVFYGGLVFGVGACADFAPALLTPGRVELLLAQPVPRWQLLAGTFLGVIAMAAGTAIYGSLGLSLVLGFKTGVFAAGPAIAGLLASFAFAAVYAVMLAVAVWLPSTPVGTLTGWLVVALGVLASHREALAEALSAPLLAFALVLTAPLPRFDDLREVAVGLAAGEALTADAPRLLAGTAVFAAAALTLAIAKLERRDF